MCKLVLGICSVHWVAVGSAIIAHHAHWTLVPGTIWAWVLPIHSTYGLSDDQVSVTCGKKLYLFFVRESQLGCVLPIHMKFQMASFSCTMLKLNLFFCFSSTSISWAWVFLIPHMAFQNDKLVLHITISYFINEGCLFVLFVTLKPSKPWQNYVFIKESSLFVAFVLFACHVEIEQTKTPPPISLLVLLESPYE